MAKKSEKVEKSEKKKGTTLNLHDFAGSIAEDLDGVSAGTVKSILSAFCEAIENTVRQGGLDPGDKINLPGVGHLVCSMKKARKARNPRTGETFTAPARPSVKFRLSAHLRLWGKPEKDAAPAAAKKGKAKK